MAYCCKPDPPTTIEQQLPTTTSSSTTTTFITDVDLPHNAIILKSHSSTFPKGITNEYRQYRKTVPRRKIPIHELEETFYIPFMEEYPNHFLYNQSMMEQLSNIFYEEIMNHNNSTVERMYRPLNDTERDEYVQLDIKNNGKKKPKKNKTKIVLPESYTIYDIIQQTRIDLQSLSHHILKPTYELMLQDIETRILLNNNDNNIVQMNETTIMNHEEIISIIKKIYTTFFHRPISIPISATQVKKRKRCNNNYYNDNDNCINQSLFSNSHHSTAGTGSSSSMNNNADDDDSFMDIMNGLDFGNELLIHDNDGNVNIGINQDPPSTGEEEERTLNDNNSSCCNVPIQSLNDDTTCSKSDNDDSSALIMDDNNNYRNIMRTTLHRTTTIDKTYETSIEFESVQSVIDCTATTEAISFSIGVAATTTDTDSDSDNDTNYNTNNNDGNDGTTPIGVQSSLSSQQQQQQQQQQDRYGSCIGTQLGISGCNDNDDDDDNDKYYHRRSQQLQFRRSNRSLLKRFGSRWDVDSIDMNNTNNITGTRRTINTNNNNNTNTTLNDFKISRIVRWFYHRIIK